MKVSLIVRDLLQTILILLICAGMVGLSVFWFDFGGLWGLVGGAVGFVWGLMGRATTTGERLGSGYIGALMGLTIGMAGAAIVIFIVPQVLLMLEARFQR